MAYAPPTRSGRIYLRMPARNMAMLKFLLEARDNLAYLSVVDRYPGLAMVVFSPDQEDEVRDLLGRLTESLDLSQVAVPGP